jgi:uncharacterized protein YegJ (DUF2314 family)
MDDDSLPQADHPDSGQGRRWAQDEWPWRDKPSVEFHWAIFEPDLTHEVMCAQASFAEFARVAEFERFRIVPVYEAIGIKAFFGPRDNPVVGEHIFLTNVFTNGRDVTATLDVGPRLRPDLKEGQVVTFSVEKLSDWFLVRAGRGLGGFTIPHVWGELSESEREQCSDQPPFSWFRHRGTQSARDELMALPQCLKCGKRNISHPNDTKQPCAICRSNSWRCDCPKCGAPLIRNAKLQKLCARCANRD